MMWWQSWSARSDATRSELACCFGGGAAFGVGFNLGVADALRDAGWDIGGGPMLGSSAGAWTAAALACGTTLAGVLEAFRDSAGVGRELSLADLARGVFGDAAHDHVSSVAYQLPSSSSPVPRRVVMRGTDHALADIVAASSSVPGMVPPHHIGGRRYIDAAIFRACSADLAARADVLVCVVPTAGGVLGAVGRGYELGARWEAQRWKLRTGGKVFFVCPDRHAVLVAGDGAQGLFDVDRAYDAYECAHEQTSTQLEHWDDATAAWPR